MRILQIILMLGCVQFSFAQQTLSEPELINIVKRFHPVAKKAAIDVSIAKADLLSARGAFDPKLSADNRSKVFTGEKYYDQTVTQLVIPTWYGIDIYAGTESLAGNKTDPESTKGNISYAGINVPLLQNLVFDKRRAGLQKARLMAEISEAERIATVNELLHDALHHYWDWWQQYHNYRLADTLVRNAQQRFNMIKTAFRLGDRPAIDTIEALAQIQNFELERTDAFMKLTKARFALSSFLWRENTEAYELPDVIIPAEIDHQKIPALDSLIVQLNRHPELMQYNFKLPALQIEKKLRWQALLPELDLKYQQLGKNYDLTKTVASPWLQNNYRFGINFSMPLRLSEGRGEYKKAKLNIERTNLERSGKFVQLENKLKQSYTEWYQTAAQLQQQSQLINNYSALQKAEETRFFNGESSLFLINAREQKALEAKQKQIALATKNKKAAVDVRWVSGIGY